MKGFSIKWRIALGATILSCALLALGGIFQAHLIRRDYSRVLSDQQFTLVSHVADEIDAKLATHLDAVVRFAATMPAHLAGAPERIRAHYHHNPAILAIFDDILVVALDGTITADFPELPGRAGTSIADRPYFQQVLATRKPVISEPVRGRARDEPVILMSAPVRGADGAPVAVVSAVIRLNKPNFLADLGSRKVGRSGYFAILTRGPNPVYVVYPERERILGARPPGANPATTRALQGFEGSVESTTAAGLRALYSYKSLHMTPWLLFVGVPVEEAFAPIVDAQRRLVIALTLVALIITPLVWLLAWRVMTPVTRLRDEIERARTVPFAFTALPVTRSDELGDLAQAFNALMEERFAAESGLRESETRLRMIANNVPALISYLDHDLRFRFANDGFRDWFGLDPVKLVGQSLREAFGDRLFEAGRAYFERALEGEKVSYGWKVATVTGERFAEVTLIPHRGETGRVVGIYGWLNDVSEHKLAQQALSQQARIDTLTGLHNRRSFDERLPEALARGARNGSWVALMFLDLDRFKAVNDTMGHGAGDDVLCEFAQRIRACVRATDMVARLGGDEFVVILEGLAGPDGATLVAEKLLRAMQPEFTTRAGPCTVYTSIGVALHERGLMEAARFIAIADAALYTVKEKGRNQYYVANSAGAAPERAHDTALAVAGAP